jgi:hypothetical protein
MKSIENFIEHLECPIVNGIIFPNETVTLIDVEVQWNKPTKYNFKIGKNVPVAEISKGEVYAWTSCVILCELLDEKNKILVLSGEAGFGGDGFVAVIDLISKKTKWIAFFDCSNPFDGLILKGQYLLASSTLNCVWQFHIINPTELVVYQDSTNI